MSKIILNYVYTHKFYDIFMFLVTHLLADDSNKS